MQLWQPIKNVTKYARTSPVFCLMKQQPLASCVNIAGPHKLDSVRRNNAAQHVLPPIQDQPQCLLGAVNA
eukprot:6477437-Amphidinium_carterae.1